MIRALRGQVLEEDKRREGATWIGQLSGGDDG
jgi:hypothetical protein